MSETLLAAEPTIRLAAFLGILGAMAPWEVAAPRRRREVPRVIRWTNNLGPVVLDTAILRLTIPILAVGLAAMGEDRGWGLFNAIDVPIWVGLVVVTPDMHRVHHSVDPRETDANTGFNLPRRDRLLGTYIMQPAKGHKGMQIGIEQVRTRRDLLLDRMLVQPLRGPAGGHALDPAVTAKALAE